MEPVNEPIAPPAPAEVVPAHSRGLMLVADRTDAPRVEIPADMPGPKDQTCKTFKVWANYAMAYRKRYSAWPVWNAKVGGQLGQLVDRLGADVAHHVAAHFLKTSDAAVLRKCHSLNELLANAESYHTQWVAAAKPILDGGDKIGARMAFIDAYQRFVGQAREDTKPVNWHVSVGFDANRRIQAVTKAMELKRIPREHAQKYLADLSVEPITEDGRAIAGLLTGTVTRPEPELRQKLELVKTSMLEMRKASAERKTEMRIDAANELADRRALLIKQAQELESRA
ncbi:hypothetical protein [Pseudomonas capeferrum]